MDTSVEEERMLVRNLLESDRVFLLPSTSRLGAELGGTRIPKRVVSDAIPDSGSDFMERG